MVYDGMMDSVAVAAPDYERNFAPNSNARSSGTELSAPPPPPPARQEEYKIGVISQEGSKEEGIVSAPRADAFAQEQNKAAVSDMVLDDYKPVTKEQKPEAPGITVKEWKPDAPYLKILEATAADKQTEKYLELKKQYKTQPSFYVDVARYFYSKHKQELAIRVLSNVCELQLEDAELLRMVATKCLSLAT